MRKFIKILTVVSALAIALSGCADRNSSSSSSNSSEPEKATQIYVYNAKGENAVAFAEMCRAYESKTGIRVKNFSIGSGQDHMETLRAEMQSSDMPAIFTVQGLKELQEWEEGGYLLDFSSLTEDGDFKALADAVPEGIRLTSNGSNNYGIPYNVEGYGYIVDRKMIYDLFGTEDILSDLIVCGYDEWEAFIKEVDAYIREPYAKTVNVNGNEYTFAGEKTGLAANLNGVFAVMAGEAWTYGDHFINVALNARFASAGEAADAAEISDTRDILMAYARALDFKTSYLAGQNGPAVRGSAFIASHGYDQTVQIFADSKALFLKQGNWAYGNISAVNAEMAERLYFLPIKMPFNDDMIKTEITATEFNSTIPVFVPMYYCINSRVSEAQRKAAMDFLVWLNTSSEGVRFITEEFDFIPYNADPENVQLDNSLGNSIIDYLKAGKTLSAPYNGSPANWSSNTVGLKIKESYLNKAEWTQDDYKAIADYAIEQWAQLKNA